MLPRSLGGNDDEGGEDLIRHGLAWKELDAMMDRDGFESTVRYLDRYVDLWHAACIEHLLERHRVGLRWPRR